MAESTATLTLADFLLARIAEDEEVAPNYDHKRSTSRPFYSNDFEVVFIEEDRWLAECEAKRRIVKQYLSYVHWYENREAEGLPADATRRDALVMRRAIELLALPYADHPDYREEWRS